MYRVEYTPGALRQLKKLPKDIQDEVTERADALAFNPRPHGCKKLVGLDEWRIKIRTYRVIYKIEDRVLQVLVIRVSHRSNAYRDL